MLKMSYVFAINVSKIMLEINCSKEIVTELFVLKPHFSHEICSNLLKRSSFCRAISCTGVERSSIRICVKFLALLCGSFL